VTDPAAGWSTVPLGKVCRVVSGATPKTGVPEFWGGDIPWITPADMSANRSQTRFGGGRSLTKLGYDSCSASLVPPGSVVVSSRAPVGYVAIAGTELATNQGCKTAVPPDSIDSKYLYWYLLAARPDLEARASGTTFKEISAWEFAKTVLRWPPMDEQQRIVDILEDHLSRLDAARRLAAQAGARLATLVEAALRALPGLDSAPMVPLAEVLREPLANGRSVPTQVGGFPVLRLTALRGERLNLAARKAGAWTAADAQPFLVARDDVFVSRGNGTLRLVGRASRVAEDPDPVAFPDTMVRFRVNDAIVVPEYLVEVWNSRLVRRQIERAARTTAGIYKVNQRDLRSVALPMLPRDAQAEAVARISAVREASDAIARQVRVSQARERSLRRALLAAAFSGRLTGRASDLDLAEELVS
jgi:type I restriction enzyme S subunit